MRRDLPKLHRVGRVVVRSQASAIVLLLIAVGAGAAVLSPTFRHPWNLANLVVQATPLVLVSIAQTYAILSGDVDLSVGGTVSLTTVLAASMPGETPGHAILVSVMLVALGAIIGSLNGLIVARIPVEPMVLTLATNVFLLGLALQVMPYPGGQVPVALLRLMSGGTYTVATAVGLILSAALLSWFILNRCRFGTHLRAVGADPQTAYRAGISVLRVKLLAHTIAGGLAAVAGLFLAARMGSGDALSGEPFSLDSMTATIAGGATFASGQGEVLGTVAGALLISLLSNILNHLGVSAYYQYVIKGVLLLVAVTVGALRTRAWAAAVTPAPNGGRGASPMLTGGGHRAA